MKKSENYDLKNIGHRMRLIRARIGVTQTTMANEIGISLSHYSKLEIGIGGMSRSLVYTICNTFGIDREWFVNGVGPDPTDIKQPTGHQNDASFSKASAGELSLDSIGKIVDLTLSKRTNKLAKVIAKQTHIPLERALSVLVYEQILSEQKGTPAPTDDTIVEEIDDEESNN